MQRQNVHKKEHIDLGKLKTEKLSYKYIVDIQNRHEVLLIESTHQSTNIPESIDEILMEVYQGKHLLPQIHRHLKKEKISKI